MPFSTNLNRREAMKWMLSSPIAPSLLHSASKQHFQSVTARIDTAIARGDATAIAVAVVQGDRIVWEQGFGWADRDTHAKATPHTPFSMASLTKPFTAATIMTLVAEGKLSLDERANRYLSEVKILGGNGDAEQVTVRLLGAHASGLPGIYQSYDGKEANLAPTPISLIRKYGRLAYPPATCYEYSNIGFAALDAIACGLTHASFGELMRRTVLAPLCLNDSFFGSTDGRWKSAATRYDPLGHAIPHYTTSTPASGELYSSVHDIAQFALWNMRRRLPGQARILTDPQIKELHRPVFVGPSGVATTFGWFRSQTPSGIPFLFKSGGDPGVANRICIAPSKDFACVVLTNQSNAWKLAYSICDELMTSVLPDWTPPEESCSDPATPFIATPDFRGQWHGTLQNDEVNIPVRLSIDSDSAGTLAIGTDREQTITAIHAEGKSFLGLCTGNIPSPDAMQARANTLQLKLLPRDGQLFGRVFAVAGDPNFKNVRLPYVLAFMRAPL
jgi:CubicO group peptidase (beta-lactamase class C family)